MLLSAFALVVLLLRVEVVNPVVIMGSGVQRLVRHFWVAEYLFLFTQRHQANNECSGVLSGSNVMLLLALRNIGRNRQLKWFSGSRL